MIKKFGILMLSLSILCLGPASAVQIGSENEFNLDSTNELKPYEINKTVLNGNETADINITLTNGTVLNGTIGNYTNGTVTNETTVLNGTIGNYTNGTFVNGTSVLNDTVGNNTNGTAKPEKNDLKENILGTLTNVALISGVVSSVFMTVGSILISLPDPTLTTKVATVCCAVGAAITGGITIGCGVACIFIYWLM